MMRSKAKEEAMSKPVVIDAAFEPEALDRDRTCWLCDFTFASAHAKDKHMHVAHPDAGRVRELDLPKAHRR